MSWKKDAPGTPIPGAISWQRLDLRRLATFTEDPSEHVRNDGAIEFGGSSDDVRYRELGAKGFGDVTEGK